jgi:hypothetical protein
MKPQPLFTLPQHEISIQNSPSPDIGNTNTNDINRFC